MPIKCVHHTKCEAGKTPLERARTDTEIYVDICISFGKNRRLTSTRESRVFPSSWSEEETSTPRL